VSLAGIKKNFCDILLYGNMDQQLDSMLNLLSELESQCDLAESIDHEPLRFGDGVYITIRETRQVVKFSIIENHNSAYFIYENTFGRFPIVSDVVLRADKILIPLIALCGIRCDESLVRLFRDDYSSVKIAENEMSEFWRIKTTGLYASWNDDNMGSWSIEIFDVNSLTGISY